MKPNKRPSRKTTGQQPIPRSPEEKSSLKDILREEKESLVSMFLTNASRSDLTAKYKLISELHSRLNSDSR